MQPVRKPTRRAFTYVELLVTCAIMGMVLTASFVLLRSANNAWTAFDADHSRLEMAHAGIRHIVRKVRQADYVTSISTAGDNSGALSVHLTDGSTVTWDHSGTQITYNSGSGAVLLASNISELTLVGYKADGTTTTTIAAEVQAVKITMKVTLTRDTSATKTLVCWAWLRAF